MTIIRHSSGASALGELFAAASDRGLVMVAFADASGRPTCIETLRRRHPDASLVEDRDALSELLAGIVDLIQHPERDNDLPVDMQGSDFELRVWKALRAVPAGITVTYGDVAARIGVPKEAREVGEACAANPLAVVVPCHRVVKRDGSISGYRWGVKRKRILLANEARLTRAQRLI